MLFADVSLSGGQDTLSLRHRIRNDTGPEHARVELRFDNVFHDPHARLNDFLRVQQEALLALCRRAADNKSLLSREIIVDLLMRLFADVGPGPTQGQAGQPLHPVAIDYIVLGSRLGTEVIRRRLVKADPDIAMPSYFLAPPVGPVWQRHCAGLDSMAARSPEADRIVADATEAFKIFDRAAAAHVS